jgi:hypothetical protein
LGKVLLTPASLHGYDVGGYRSESCQAKQGNAGMQHSEGKAPLSFLIAHARSQSQEPKRGHNRKPKGIAAEHPCGFEAYWQILQTDDLDCHKGEQDRKHRKRSRDDHHDSARQIT